MMMFRAVQVYCPVSALRVRPRQGPPIPPQQLAAVPQASAGGILHPLHRVTMAATIALRFGVRPRPRQG